MIGNRSDGVRDQLMLYLSIYRPARVSVMIGTNDKDWRTLAHFIRNCESIIETARQYNISLLFSSYLLQLWDGPT